MDFPVDELRRLQDRQDELDHNLSRKTERSLPILNTEAKACRKRSLTLAARWKNAASFARRMMRLEEAACSKGAWLKAQLAFISALAVVFLIPSASSRLKSWHDCWSLGFNLMFLSALPGAVLAVVTSNSGAEKNELESNQPETNEQEKKRDCCCDHCECCECCEGCWGCEGSCDTCNCCDGGCDCCGCDCG